MNADEALPLIVIVGPTAVGKTELSLLIAERLPVEIISADSTQVYRGLDIGTDKVSPEIRRRVPHHLIDIRDPDEPYSVADFQRDATAAIAAIRGRGRYPVLVGGTGFYVTALLYGYSFPDMPPDPELRQRLLREYDDLGGEAMHRRLAAVDADSARRIHPHDRKRLVRALEIWYQTGRRPSEVRERRGRPRFGARCFGLTDERASVYRAIEERVDRQLARGLVEEVKGLLAAGYSPELPALQALGYKEIIGYLRGEYDLAEARRRLVRNTRRYAKRQWTWFRHQLDARWFHRGRCSLPAIADRIAAEVQGEGGPDGPGGRGECSAAG
ncbi:MAG TPA: tRNA (adenosine(37)-N6)-dimethylallyltransferase MiaA [Thermaerobacter sp.]